jgi:exodeoxyribonuclease VII large subunit
MSDFGPLFGGPPKPSSRRPARRVVDDPFGDSLFPEDADAEVPTYEAATGPRTYGVREINLAIGRALQSSFSREVRVRGEIQGLDRNLGRDHWYFELVEKDPGSERIQARLSVVLLASDRRKVDRDLSRVPGFALRDHLEVCLKGRVDFYAPYGKLQLRVTGVDPEATLGKLAAQRERILAALAGEGLLERNGQLPLPAVPAHVGLVTSVGSAAYNDFVQEIQASGLALRVTCVDARVQGLDTEPTVVAALRTLARIRPDVVVLVRGGGSRSDLAGFDSERIARTIAAMPVPVFCGIGHETDECVADKVAARSLKTPTACAAELVQMVREFVADAEDRFDRIHHLAQRRLAGQATRLSSVSHRVAGIARRRVEGESRLVTSLAARLGRGAPRTVVHRSRALSAITRRVAVGTQRTLAHHAQRLRGLRRSLDRGRLQTRMLRHRGELEALARRLPATASRRLRRDEARLQTFEARTRALDPRRVLARGYSLTTDESGRLVRDATLLAAGQRIHTQLAQGSVASRVEETRPEEDES